MDFLLLVVAGALIGAVSSMIGVGGGILMVPLLSFFYVSTTQEAVGTSLAAVVVTSISSSLHYARKNVIDYRLALVLMPSLTAGAWLGAWLTGFISSEGLSLLFGLLLLYPAVLMLLGREPKEAVSARQGGATSNAWHYVLQASAFGVVFGVASGFFGVGSGILMVPAMVLLLKVEMLQAVATSLLVMMPSALVGSIQHWFQHNLHAELMIPVALGIIVGTQVGPRIAIAISRVQLRRAFGVVLVYAALNMIWKGVAGWGG